MNEQSIGKITLLLNQLRAELGRVFIGQEEVVDGVLTAFLAGGHVLIEGVPGLGKTLLAKTLSRLVECRFNRIQFTPDLMPADITGSHVFNLQSRQFEFYPGPIFTHILLADEINRAPAKTHAALLQVMEEHHVTIDGKNYPLERPFFTMATQNPIESEGTYALPEAQLDRFMFKLLIQYPTEQHEEKIMALSIHQTESPEAVLSTLKPVIDSTTLAWITGQIGVIRVEEPIIRYANQLVRKTRVWKDVYNGASPRAGITLLRGACIQALLNGRDFVTPDDIIAIGLPTMRHRIILAPEAEVEGKTADSILGEIIKSVEVPRKP